MQSFDVAVIGAGSGLIIMEEAIRAGKSVAVIEKGAFGGTCLNRGCIPSKMLVYPADLIREAQAGERVGVSFAAPQVDFEKVTRRMRRQIDVNHALEQQIKDTRGVTVFQGRASFLDSHRLQIDLNDGTQTQITAQDIVIATGSRTRPVEIPGLLDIGFVTSESFFGEGFPQQPYQSLLIIGGGTTALEIAHIFSAFGSAVHIAVRSETILRGMDQEVARFVAQRMEEAGVPISYHARPVEARLREGLKEIVFEDANTKERFTLGAEQVFLAPGIIPNTDKLNLAAAGVQTDGAGHILTNERLGTNVPHIHALGDVNGLFPLRHKANYEAEVLSNQLFGDGTWLARYDAVPMAVFTHPQAAGLGLSEQEARAKLGNQAQVTRAPYSDVVAGMAMGYSKRRADDGFVKIIRDQAGRILGAHAVGPQAAMIVQPYAYLMHAGEGQNLGSSRPVQEAMTIHPTFSELAAWPMIYEAASLPL